MSNEDRTKIIKDDSGTQRFLQGYQRGGFSNGDVGVKVSQLGIDVATATDDELIWSTDFNTFKIIDEATITISVNFASHGGVGVSGSESASGSYDHNLGRRPAFMCFGETASNFPISNGSIFDVKLDSNSHQVIRWSVQTTSNSISVGLFNVWHSSVAGNTTNSFAGDYNVKVYILEETAS